MSIEETRQLGIEFERRIQTMIPEKEYADKLDSETIYSFLNEYQDKYIHSIYASLDTKNPDVKISSHVESILQSLYKQVTIDVSEALFNATENIEDYNGVILNTARSIKFEMPSDFYVYIRSVSNVTSTYSFTSANNSRIRILPNQLVSQFDVWKLLETPHDSLRILRYPAAVLDVPRYDPSTSNNRPTLTCIYDRYTTVNGINVLYYKRPVTFDIMTNTACELPYAAFDDLVSGAVDLYVQYVAGAEARKRQQDETRRQANARNNKNNDEQ